MMKAIHINDARKILDSGQPCDLVVWKLTTGDILVYKGVRCIGSHFRGGIHRILLPNSREIREFRDVTLFEINGMEVYL